MKKIIAIKRVILISFFFSVLAFPLGLAQNDQGKKYKASLKDCAKMHLKILRLEQNEILPLKDELKIIKELPQKERELKDFSNRQKELEELELRLDAMKVEYIKYDCDKISKE